MLHRLCVLFYIDLERRKVFLAGVMEFLQDSLRGGTVNEDESALLIATAGQGPAIALDESDHMHFDLHVDSEDELAMELERLTGLGAKRVDWSYPDDAHFVVLADTEGNLFCVVNTGGTGHIG